MNYLLENPKIRISVSDHGAELHSIYGKENETEYLWKGDPEYWKYHAPTLFPIVGKLKDLKCSVDGETYEMPAHGLARISDFKLVDKKEDYISFEFKYDEETLKKYPYKFSFIIAYTLEEDKVKVTYNVKNLDDKKMYFSVGAHPAFMCPIEDGENLEDCYLQFNRVEDAYYTEITEEVYLKHTKKLLMKKNDMLPLSKELFSGGLMMLDGLKSNSITIKSKKSSKSLGVEFEGFPYVGLWAPEKGAPFMCIEPWFGHPDYEDFNGDFSEKHGNISLEVNQEFNRSYNIVIGQ